MLSMRKGIALTICLISAVPTTYIAAESIKFTTSFPKVYEEFIRDEGKHTNHLTVNGFIANVEYKMRVLNADTGEVLPSGSRVPKGTRVKMEFLPETMSYVTSGGYNDTPIAHWQDGTPPVQCVTAERIYHRSSTYKGRPRVLSVFAPVYAKRPAHSITNVSAMGGCAGPEDARICTAENVGTHDLAFAWAQSSASMYLRWLEKDDTKHAPPRSRWPRYGVCEPIGKLSSRTDFAGGRTNEPQSAVALARKTLPYRLIVEEGPEIPTQPPQQPNLTAVAGACVVGQSYSISMTANDPDGDTVRYLVDWNNDGTVDQFVPTSGYVNSGSAQTATKIFAAPGSKTVRVRTQDDNGALSSWASMSVECTGEADSTIVDLDGENDPNLGNDPVIVPSVNDLSLRALPSLVRLGATTKIHWSSQNMTSCTVNGSNGDNWTGLSSPVSGEVSGAINGLVTYTLTCRAGGENFSKTATVNVLPSWVEK
jgi:hypothetical protein